MDAGGPTTRRWEVESRTEQRSRALEGAIAERVGEEKQN